MKITQLPVPNFKKGRDSVIKGVCVHVGEGNRNQIYSTFLNEEKSSHYLVNRDGSVWQFVQEKDTAWASGKLVRPSSVLVMNNPKLNPNEYLVQIESEGYATQEPTEELMNTLAELVEDICRRNFIEITNLNIIPHKSIRADKSCPGKIDTTKIVRMAQKIREDNTRQLTPQEESYFLGIIKDLYAQIIELIKRAK